MAVAQKIGFWIVWLLQSMIKSWTECTTVVNWKNKLKEAVQPIDDKTMNFANTYVFCSMHRKQCIQYLICFSWPCTLPSCLMCDGWKGFVMQINCNLHEFMNLTGCLCGPHFSRRVPAVYMVTLRFARYSMGAKCSSRPWTWLHPGKWQRPLSLSPSLIPLP